MARKGSRGGGSIINAAKQGFGFSLGGLGAVVVYIFVAMLFFIPGVLILANEKQKAKESRNTTMLVVAYVLMFIGCIVGLGLGADTIFGSLMEDL